MNRKQAQKVVDRLLPKLEENRIIFQHLQKQIENISAETIEMRDELLGKVDVELGYDDYYDFSAQLGIDWLPSSYQC